MILPISSQLANVIGFAGMACIVFAYAYITGRERPNPLVQHGVNLLGACLLTISLLVNLNPASLVLEGFWAAIAIWGLVKAVRDRTSGTRARQN
ncbi:permease [Novosphingobium sp. PY1]|uniref:CBU_0592 family membrane protein n=1 Tax=Novosphingobium sp. PY1 TaxID=1882221 RepID=UPI001A8C0EB8|nr:permease [Novosphingobium sp. PY1]GFM27661.1 permease [Novosphingobium sp. PY1]